MHLLDRGEHPRGTAVGERAASIDHHSSSFAMALPPPLVDVVRARNNEEETVCFETIMELRAICTEYCSLLFDTGSRGYDRIQTLLFWIIRLQDTFQEQYRAQHPYSRAVVRAMVEQSLIVPGDFDVAFKPYKGLGFTKARVANDRAKFHDFYAWLME
jgi:hypothetical protein